MEKKVFILGITGSEKTMEARYIECLAKSNWWVTVRFNDYDILYEMFAVDKDGNQFSSTQYSGFDVHDHTVFDDALNELEERILNRKKEPASTCEQNELIIIEFARNDYCRALEMFSPEFLKNTSFIFIDADI